MITRRRFISKVTAGSAGVAVLLHDDTSSLAMPNESKSRPNPTYVVTEACVGCKYTCCAQVCPVEAFHELPDRVYINPDTCINCDACVPVCPVRAIYADTNAPSKWTILNEENARLYPVISQKKLALNTKGRCKAIEDRVKGEVTTYFSKDHLWVTSTGKVGITDHANATLGEIQGITLPRGGAHITANRLFGRIEHGSRETGTSTFKLTSPVSGKVLDENTCNLVNGHLIKADPPYGEGWLIRVELSNKSEFKELMDETAYRNFIRRTR